ncbi:MAG: hypothetical protein AB1714_07435 [Acidobacteriota bacterium]
MKSLVVLAGMLCLFAVNVSADYYEYNGDWRSVYIYNKPSQQQGGYYAYPGDWRAVYMAPYSPYRCDRPHYSRGLWIGPCGPTLIIWTPYYPYLRGWFGPSFSGHDRGHFYFGGHARRDPRFTFGPRR